MDKRDTTREKERQHLSYHRSELKTTCKGGKTHTHFAIHYFRGTVIGIRAGNDLLCRPYKFLLEVTEKPISIWTSQYSRTVAGEGTTCISNCSKKCPWIRIYLHKSVPFK